MSALSWTALVAAFIWAGPTEAQSSAAFELSAFGGTIQFLADDPARMIVDIDDSDEDLVIEDGELDDPLHLGFTVAYRFTEAWAIEGMFAWAPSTLSAVNLPEDLDVDLLRYAFNARFDTPSWNRTQLMLGLGMGWETFEYAMESADPDVHFAANAMAGVGIRLVDDLRLRLDAREWLVRLNEHDEMSAEWESDLMLSTGLSWGLPLDR